jgi:ketosteroid isomerase-like protein
METAVTPVAARVEELSARLQEVEDKQAIASLLNRYVVAVDSFDWDGWGRCWAPEAVANFGRHGELVGREAIVTAARNRQTIYQDQGSMQHILVNVELKVRGDTAEGGGNLVFVSALERPGGPPDHALGGRYRWIFTRDADGWAIARAELRRAWDAVSAPAGSGASDG